MNDFMYSLANDDANFSLIGRRVCVNNRSDVTRDSVAFCTSARKEIFGTITRVQRFSQKRTGDEHVHACMAKMSDMRRQRSAHDLDETRRKRNERRQETNLLI